MDSAANASDAVETPAFSAPTTSFSLAQNDAELLALKLAEEYFPGAVGSIEDSFDPEDPTWRRRVIVVTTPGDIQDLLARELAWHGRMRSELGQRGEHIILSVHRE